MCEIFHTLSYINDFLRYEISYLVLSASKTGTLLTVKEVKECLAEFVENGSISKDSINRFLMLRLMKTNKNISGIRKNLPGITLHFQNKLQDTLLVPTEPILLKKYVEYYQAKVELMMREMEIKDPDFVKLEKESEERVKRIMDRILRTRVTS